MGTDTSDDRFWDDYVEEPHRAPVISVLDAWDHSEAMYRMADADEDTAEFHIFRGLD